MNLWHPNTLVGLVSLILGFVLLLIVLSRQKYTKQYKATRSSEGLVYRFLSESIWIGKYIKRYSRSLMHIATGNSKGIETPVIRHFFVAFLIASAQSVVLWEVVPSITAKLTTIVLGFWTFDQVMAFQFSKIKNTLLKDLVTFIGDIRIGYFDTWSVEDALYMSMGRLKTSSGSSLLAQGGLLIEMLESPNTESALNDFMEQAPNQYLKLLACILYVTKEFGDSPSGEPSRFAKSLNLIMQEVRDEIIWRDKLNYALKSLGFIVIAPLFFISPIRDWAMNSFEVMGSFYNGHMGYICEMLVVCSTLLSAYLLKEIQSCDDDFDVSTGLLSFLSRGFYKPFLSISRDKLHAKSIGFAMFFILVYVLVILVASVRYGLNLAETLGMLIFCGVLVGLIGWGFIHLNSYFEHYLLEIAKQSEVERFHSIILTIMYVPQMGADDILIWLERFSTFYSKDLQRAILDFDSGGLQALQRLSDANDSKEFDKIITQLMLAVESLSIEKAFEELDAEKSFYQEKRKLSQDRMVQKKIYLGQVIGFAPVYCALIFYFTIPMLYASVQEMNRYVEVLS